MATLSQNTMGPMLVAVEKPFCSPREAEDTFLSVHSPAWAAHLDCPQRSHSGGRTALEATWTFQGVLIGFLATPFEESAASQNNDVFMASGL